MEYIVRERNSNKNLVYKSNHTLNYLYNTKSGRILLKAFVSKSFNKMAGTYLNSHLSKTRIKMFIRDNNINLDDYEKKKYKSFNDFFIRKIKENKRNIDYSSDSFISPCDSKVLAYKINKNLTLNIKGGYYTINSLVNKNILNEYKDGYALVFRLDPSDYHRYIYIDNGIKGENTYIKGTLHTVQPISLNHYNYFNTNSREYSVLNTDNFGEVIQIEIGAMLVGKIHNNHSSHKFYKGEEKGYFEFGGSTICLLVKKNIIKIDNDIMENSNIGVETIVKLGERIGVRNN